MKRRRGAILCIAMTWLLLIGCADRDLLPDEPVRPVITLHNEPVAYVDGPYCWYGSQAEGVCGDPPHPDEFNRRIKERAAAANSGDVIRIGFTVIPDECTLTVVKPDGMEESVPLPDGDRFQLSRQSGYYRYWLSAVWGDRNTAAYHFGIHVNGDQGAAK